MLRAWMRPRISCKWCWRNIPEVWQEADYIIGTRGGYRIARCAGHYANERDGLFERHTAGATELAWTENRATGERLYGGWVA